MYFSRKTLLSIRTIYKELVRAVTLALLPSLFILFFTCSSAFAANASAIHLDVEIDAGFSNSYRVNGWIPFRITVDSREEGFSGEIQVIPNTNAPNQMAYAAPINIPAFSKKEIEFSVFSNMIQKQMTVQFVNNGKLILEKDVDFDKQLSPTVPVAGILSESFSSLQYLNGMKLSDNGREGLEVIQLQAKTFPHERKVLDNFDIIYAGNFDTSSLDEEQKNTLLQWVDDGGILVLGTGPAGRKVLNPLPEKLKIVEISGNSLMDAGSSMEALAGLERYTSRKFLGNEKLALSDMKIRRGAALVSAGNRVVIAEDRLGNGSIITMGFDPALQPVTDWSGNQSMWKNLLSHNSNTRLNQKIQQVAMGMPIGKYVGGYYGPSNIPADEMPSIWWIMIILGIYIVIVGPVNYMILKKRDKRDLMWVTVPAISVLVLGIIYVSGFRTRFTGPIITSTSVVKVSSGSLRASVTSGVQVTSPFKGILRLDFKKGTEITPNGGDNYYARSYPGPDQKDKNGKVVARLISSDYDSVEYLDMQTWGSRNFTLNKDFILQGALFDEIIIDKEELIIKVNNKTGLEYKDACVRIGNNYIDLEDIGIAESREIRVTIDPALRMDFYSYLNKKFGQNAGRVQGQKVTREQQEAFRRRQILESNYNIVQEINMTHSGEASFFAWSRDLLDNQITAGDKPVKNYNTNVFLMSVPYSFKKTGDIRILPGFVKPELHSGDYSINAKMMSRQPGGDSVIVRNDGDVVFSFKIPEYINPSKLQIIWDTNTVPGYGKPVMPGQTSPVSNAKLFVQNQITHDWEEISALHTVSNEISKYMTPDNKVMVKASVKIDRNVYPEAFVRYPDIDISGVDK